MQVTKNDLGKSQIELVVELTLDEFKPYIKQGAEKVSKEVKIEGFRPGKVPYDILKAKTGEMTILEEAARIAVNKTIGEAIDKHIVGQPVGQPQVDITKLAPDNPLEYKVKIATLPEIKLGEYKGLKIKAEPVKIDDQEVEKMINDLREMRVQEKIKAGEIKEGDKAVVDINMFLDNVPIDGGQSKDAAVIIGKDYIVKGFDKQLIGMNKGDEREFKLPYPNDFHMKNLAGKLVEFKVKVKDTFERVLPEVNDDFAKGFGAKHADDFRENIKKTLTTEKKRETKQKTESRLLEKIAAKTDFGELPQLLIDHETHTMLHELEDSVAQQGGKFDDYLSHLGKTREQLTLDMLPDAIKRVKVSLLIREIAKQEKIAVTDEDAQKQIEDMRRYYESIKGQHPDAEQMIEQTNRPEYKDYVLNVLTSRKVVDKLWEWNVVD